MGDGARIRVPATPHLELEVIAESRQNDQSEVPQRASVKASAARDHPSSSASDQSESATAASSASAGWPKRCSQ